MMNENETPTPIQKYFHSPLRRDSSSAASYLMVSACMSQGETNFFVSYSCPLKASTVRRQSSACSAIPPAWAYFSCSTFVRVEMIRAIHAPVAARSGERLSMTSVSCQL